MDHTTDRTGGSSALQAQQRPGQGGSHRNFRLADSQPGWKDPKAQMRRFYARGALNSSKSRSCFFFFDSLAAAAARLSPARLMRNTGRSYRICSKHKGVAG
jgi:hypothetical protein